jgi:hypothetical protein
MMLRVVGIIVIMLTGDSPSVAMALSYMGPKAGSAIPALEKALAERDGRDQGKTSAAAIRVALQKIRKKPRPDPRQHSK